MPMEEGEGARARREELSYTRPPSGPAPGRKREPRSGAEFLAAAALFLSLAYLSRHAAVPSAPPPAAEAPAAPAAAPAAAPSPPAAEPLPMPRAARKPLYLGMSISGRPPTEPEQLSGMKYYGGFYDPVVDGFPVAGDFIDVVVDGKPARMPLKPAVRPGARKLFVVMPPDTLPHTIEFRPVYDLGPDGLVQVTETILDDGKGNKVYISRSPVDSVVLRRGDPPRRLMLKN